MELAMQTFSNDKSMRYDTVQTFENLTSRPLVTKAEKGEDLISMMFAIKKVFVLMDGHIVERATENKILKSRIGSHDEN